MTLRIKILSEKISNQIAAGEVVERPASVVKELVENAVDAGSTMVEIDIRGAGKSYIMVKDNGFGMEKDDLFTAFERHATSKVANENDLASIKTLGFRGEALPSIASVSKVRMESRNESSENGAVIKIEGGKTLTFDEVPLSKGTRMEVSHLFFNVPARRKFLKTDTTEQNHINNAVIQQILANETVGFHYIINGKLFVKVPPEASFLQRVKLLFGESLAEKLIPVDFTYNSIAIKGYIIHPNFSPSHANYQFSFLNGRFIKDRVIYHGVLSGLKNVMSSEKKPGYFLNIALPYDSVDVNVHPSKYEVRFVQPQQVHFVLEQAVLSALENKREDFSPVEENKPIETPDEIKRELTPLPTSHDPLAEKHFNTWKSVQRGVESQSGYTSGFKPFSPSKTSDKSFKPHEFERDFSEKKPLPQFELNFDSVSPSLQFSHLNYIGQWQKSFLLFDSEDGIILVDQHTAHERIKKEILTKNYERGSIERSNLLIPVRVEVPIALVEMVKKNLKGFARIGFDIESAENNAFFINGIPALVSESPIEELFDDLIAAFSENPTVTFTGLIDDILDRIACHSAVRANQKLDRDSVKLLCKQLDELKIKLSCPHGRPIALLIKSREILKGFHRV
ncbi:MAG: DNA mismatch repair endonuclease MutL [Nitrospinae bacterium]|nr:DNA mismatch repair endonuclease MutL [Nitrospinota bacterium]